MQLGSEWLGQVVPLTKIENTIRCQYVITVIDRYRGYIKYYQVISQLNPTYVVSIVYYLYMGVSENSVPLHPMVNGEYTLFSDKPKYFWIIPRDKTPTAGEPGWLFPSRGCHHCSSPGLRKGRGYWALDRAPFQPPGAPFVPWENRCPAFFERSCSASAVFWDVEMKINYGHKYAQLDITDITSES